MVSVIACSDSNENSVENDKGSSLQVKKSIEQSPPQETPPEVRREPVHSNSAPAPWSNDSDWGGWEALTEEQHEEQVEKISDRLDEIVDVYYENEDLEELDPDMLLEMLREDFPEELQDDIPEEVLEEIEWWTE